MVDYYTSWFYLLFVCWIICASVAGLYQPEVPHYLGGYALPLPRDPGTPKPPVGPAEAEGGITLTNCPRNITLPTATGQAWAIASWMQPTFIDREGSSVIYDRTHAPGLRFSVGNTVVRYTVALKRAPICSFTITVRDEEPPRLVNCPADITQPADNERNSASNIRWDVPQATDNVRVAAVESTHTIGTAFTLGRTEVMYYARDGYGNVAHCAFNIYITDVEDPVCAVCPDDISETVGPTETRKAVSWRLPVFRDNSGSTQLSSSHHRGDSFLLGHTAVVYTASDPSGNTATCSFHVLLKVQVPNNRIFVRHFTMTEIEITWAQIMNKTASSYLIYVWNVGSREPLASDHIYYPINRQETFATMTLAGLFPGVKYNIKVVVTGIDKQLNIIQRTKPNSPGSLTVAPGSLSPVSGTLIWQSGGGVFDQYQLSYRKIGSEIRNIMRTLDKTTTFYNVDGLDPGTAYVFKVASISGTGETSTISTPRVLTVTTESLPEEKILLTNVTSTSVSLLCRISTHHQVEFRLEDESADRGYVVLIYSDDNDIFTDVVFDAWPLKYQFTSLKPHTYYHIRVVSNEMGAYYETTATTRPTPIYDIWINAISNSSATLEWDHISLHTHTYEISITPNYQKIELPIRTPSSKVVLNGLKPRTTYIVTVVSVYDNLRSDPVDLKVTPGVDEPKSIATIKEHSCVTPIITASCLAGILFIVFLYVVKTCITHNGKHIPAHHAEENEYENPNQRSNSIYSAQYQNTSNSRRESTVSLGPSQQDSDQASLIYPTLNLRATGPKRPKLRRVGYVEEGLEDDDEMPMYYNIPAKLPPKTSDLPNR
ncbi:uncharacterized protein [Amphiura filiformis]|uniref:uncharacterized protein n=1 Tax=Amphiura filiformis TaxID=82378 RepID=UPI003B218E83